MQIPKASMPLTSQGHARCPGSPPGFVLALLLFALPVFPTGLEARARRPRVAASPSAEGGVMSRVQLVARLRRAYADPLARAGTFAVYVKVLKGPVLFARRGGQGLHPASCVKLVTSAAALRELGVDFRFVTALRGTVQGAILTSPLGLVGQGDPSLRHEHLRELALALKQKGITEIPSLVVDDTDFDAKRWPPGFRHPSSSAYSTPTGAVSLDGNTVEVVITPAAQGQRAEVALLPPSDYLELKAGVTSGERTSLVVNATRAADRLRVQVTGTVKAGGPPERRWARVLDPARYAGESFRRLLESAGIKVGPLKLRQKASGPELLRHQSKPLAELVAHMNRTSDNFYAEQILKALAARKSGPPGSTEKGIRIAEGLLQRSGLRRGTYRMENGSGLFGNQRFSPKQLVQLLERLHTLPWLFNALRESLAVAGLHGTLAKRLQGTAAAGRLRGKTGTLNGVSCLAGFVDGPPGKPPLVFAMLHNGFVGPQARSRQVQDDMVKIMARYMLGH